MGTRADFYVGRGSDAEWLGSIGFDGYPSAIDVAVLSAWKERDYRVALASFFKDRSDYTSPEQGWPWPWDDSRTTDYAYAFDGGHVLASCFGHQWFDPTQPEPDHADGEAVAEFPDMSAIKKVTFGKRSGLTVIGPTGPVDMDAEELHK